MDCYYSCLSRKSLAWPLWNLENQFSSSSRRGGLGTNHNNSNNRMRRGVRLLIYGDPPPLSLYLLVVPSPGTLCSMSLTKIPITTLLPNDDDDDNGDKRRGRPPDYVIYSEWVSSHRGLCIRSPFPGHHNNNGGGPWYVKQIIIEGERRGYLDYLLPLVSLFLFLFILIICHINAP